MNSVSVGLSKPPVWQWDRPPPRLHVDNIRPERKTLWFVPLSALTQFASALLLLVGRTPEPLRARGRALLIACSHPRSKDLRLYASDSDARKFSALLGKVVCGLLGLVT